MIDLEENSDPQAWDRILDAFIEAVEKEDGHAGGGMHATGSCEDWCIDCKEIDDE